MIPYRQDRVESRGRLQMPLTLQAVIVTAGIVGAMLTTSVVACTGSVPPNVVQGGVAAVELAVCILNTYSQAQAAGQDTQQAVATTIRQCATDAATIATVLDASHAAEARLRASDAGR